MPSAAITVTNLHASRSMSQYRTVRTIIDHADLVSDSISRADARDVYVAYQGVPLPTLIIDANTTTAEVFFALQDDLAALTADSSSYTLHYGDLQRKAFATPDIERLSQFHPWVGGSGAIHPVRNQPCLFYDPFTHKRSGGDWAVYAALDIIDTNIYSVDNAALWAIASGLCGRIVTSGTPTNGRATVSNLLSGYNNVQVRTRLYVPTGVTNIVTGVNVRGRNTNINGYSCGPGATPTASAVGEWAADVLTGTVATGSVSPTVLDRTVEVVLGAFGSELNGLVDGQPVAGTDGTHTTGAPGLMDQSTSISATSILFTDVQVEIYDGVKDNEYTATTVIPSLTLPCPGFPTSRELESAQIAANDPGQFLSTRSWQVSPLDTTKFKYRATLGPEEYWEAVALRKANRSVGTFSFTFPGDGSSSTVRILPGSFRGEKLSHTHFSVECSLEKVPV